MAAGDSNAQPAIGQPLLNCQGVSKYYGALAAVKDLSFELAEGEVLGIGGPNGAGKTTLFDVISALSPCTAGRIEFAGHAIEALPPHRVCQLGIARTFQLNAGFDTLTLRHNVLTCCYFGRRNRRLPGIGFGHETEREVDELIEFLGLGDFRNVRVGILPVYQRKLMMIAGALATGPRLLLIDEPVGGLNSSEIDRVLELIKRIRARGVTIIVIEHVMRFLLRLSDRVMILHHGEKIFDGRSRELTHDKRVVDVYLGVETARRLDETIAPP